MHNGLLLLNKKSGFTSFDSLSLLKRLFSTGKIGHTGTLDKFASGLLLALVGRGVKLAPLFANLNKEYYGTIYFGKETDTLDPEGTVIAEAPLPSKGEVETALISFRGEISQSPPAYSAIHIKGRRAHELVREGKQPEMKKRPVTVHNLQLVSWTPPTAVIQTQVSAGTYIRSLARDIALSAGSRAYLSALERTAVGAFRLENATADAEIDVNSLRPLDKKLFDDLGLPCFLLEKKVAEHFCNGGPLEKILSDGEFCAPDSNTVFPAAEFSAAGVFKKGAENELLGFLKCNKNEGNFPWVYGHVFSNN